MYSLHLWLCIRYRCLVLKVQQQIKYKQTNRKQVFVVFSVFLTLKAICLYICVCVASHISETSEAVAVKHDMVTASVTGLHHMLIILTLIIIQGHTVLIMKVIYV